jgi:hypothetical protein
VVAMRVKGQVLKQPCVMRRAELGSMALSMVTTASLAAPRSSRRVNA